MWCLQCRDAGGRPRRFTIGQHPATGLAKARNACRALREQVRQGADPTTAARQKRDAAKQAQNNENTLAGLIGIYARQKGAQRKSWPESKRRIESVFAKHLGRPWSELTLQELQQTADRWPSNQSAAAAVRYIRPLLKWASHPGREYVVRDLALITPPAIVQRRKRVLSPEELAKLLPVLRGATGTYAACLQFILLTLCRREEAAGAKWGHIDFAAQLWRLPETKNGQEHVVPLSRQAIALLRSRLDGMPDPDALVFPSDNGITKLANWDRACKSFMDTSGTSDWTRHDLRRTGATLLGKAGVETHIIEAALGHVSIHSQLAATYNQSRYEPQVRAALQKLADQLDIIAKGGARVLPMQA
jgi:integrase